MFLLLANLNVLELLLPSDLLLSSVLRMMDHLLPSWLPLMWAENLFLIFTLPESRETILLHRPLKFNQHWEVKTAGPGCGPDWHPPASLWGSWCFQSAGSVALLSTPNRPRLSRSMFFTLQNSWLFVFCVQQVDMQLVPRMPSHGAHQRFSPLPLWRPPWWCGRGCWAGAAAVAGSDSACGSSGWSSSGGSCEADLQRPEQTHIHTHARTVSGTLTFHCRC